MSRLYRLLAVDQDADEVEIRSAYRGFARKYHPDLNPSAAAAQRFAELTEAYAVLSDSGRRALYDRFGEVSLRDDFVPPLEPIRSQATGAAQDVSILGGRRGGAAGAAPRAKRQAASDWSPSPASAGRAQGSAGERSALSVSVRQLLAGARLTLAQPGGSSLTVDLIPLSYRLGRAAVKLADGATRDIPISPLPDRFYRLQPPDVILELPISIGEAAHGAVVVIQLPDGPLRIDVEKARRGGETLRFGGRGLHRPAGGRGDLVVVLSVRLPHRFAEALCGRALLADVSTEYGAALRAGIDVPA